MNGSGNVYLLIKYYYKKSRESIRAVSFNKASTHIKLNFKLGYFLHFDTTLYLIFMRSTVNEQSVAIREVSIREVQQQKNDV